MSGGRTEVVLRTLDEIWEAGLKAGAALPPLSQEQVDQVAVLLCPLPAAGPAEVSGRGAEAA